MAEFGNARMVLELAEGIAQKRVDELMKHQQLTQINTILSGMGTVNDECQKLRLENERLRKEIDQKNTKIDDLEDLLVNKCKVSLDTIAERVFGKYNYAELCWNHDELSDEEYNRYKLRLLIEDGDVPVDTRWVHGIDTVVSDDE